MVKLTFINKNAPPTAVEHSEEITRERNSPDSLTKSLFCVLLSLEKLYRLCVTLSTLNS